MNKRPSYGQGLSFGVVSFGLLAVLGFVSSVAIARLYGVTVLGQYALVSAPVNVLFGLSSAREQVGLVRELSSLPHRAPRVTGLFYAVLLFSFSLTTVLGILTVAGVYFLFNGPIDAPELFIPTVASIIGYTIFQNTCWNVDMVFSAFGAGRELFWTRLSQALGFLGLAILGGFAWSTIWGLVAATVLSFVIALAHKVVLLKRYMRATVPSAELKQGFEKLPELIRFGLKLTPGQIADGASYEVGTFALGILSPVAVLGAYSRAMQLARRFLDLQWKVIEMLFPTLVRRREEGDHDGFDRALADTIRYSVAGMLLPASIMGGAATGIMSIFGPGFSHGSGALVILMLMPVLTTLASLQRGSLVAVNRPWTTAISGAIRLTVTIVATIILVNAFGATGAALGIIVGSLLELGYTSYVTRQHLSRPVLELWPLRQMASTVIAYAVGFATARLIYSSLSSWAGLLAALATGAVFYVVAFLICGGFGPRDRARISSTLGAVRRRRAALDASQ